ncbi:MAG TPA: SLC13 family permease, partial [Longilinea sp.]|nr:SLC13 family permease [Longilinea sp.]
IMAFVMGITAWFVLIITLIAAIFLLAGFLRQDMVALILLSILGITGIVTPQDIFSGFSSPAVITLLGVFLLTEGLRSTGATSELGCWLAKVGAKTQTAAVFSISLAAATLSLIMNNVAAVGVLIPTVQAMADKANLSQRRLLLPAAFGVSLGGMATLLTNANIIMGSALRSAGYNGYGLLDFFPVGAPAILAGVLFLAWVGWRLLPEKKVDPLVVPVINENVQPSKKKIRVAVAILVITLVLAAFDFVSVPEILLAGGVLMALTGCVTLDGFYHKVDWRVIFLIAGMWPLSIAIGTSGLAAAGSELIVSLTGSAAPLVIAAIIMAVAMGITQILSSQVTALIVAPLAITLAVSTGIDPRAMGMAAALGCSMAFITPYGHAVNLLVMHPGGYATRDFIKVGVPMTVIVYIVLLTGLHFFWGL